MFKEPKIKLVGRLNAVLTKPDGSQEKFERKNLIVDTGIDFLCDAAGKPSSRPGVVSHIAIGEGVTAADASDTALETELTRKAATYAHTAGASTFTMVSTFNPGEGTGDVSEAGVLNAGASGILLNRVVFAAIPKEAGDTLEITFTFTLTPA